MNTAGASKGNGTGTDIQTRAEGPPHPIMREAFVQKIIAHANN